jgi:hypothetical protein
MMQSEFMWPECFITGIVDTRKPNLALCADALTGWANCMAGQKPPEKFGDAMAKISMRLGIAGTPENFMAYAEQSKEMK